MKLKELYCSRNQMDKLYLINNLKLKKVESDEDDENDENIKIIARYDDCNYGPDYLFDVYDPSADDC